MHSLPVATGTGAGTGAGTGTGNWAGNGIEVGHEVMVWHGAGTESVTGTAEDAETGMRTTGVERELSHVVETDDSNAMGLSTPLVELRMGYFLRLERSGRRRNAVGAGRRAQRPCASDRLTGVSGGLLWWPPRAAPLFNYNFGPELSGGDNGGDGGDGGEGYTIRGLSGNEKVCGDRNRFYCCTEALSWAVEAGCEPEQMLSRM